MKRILIIEDEVPVLEVFEEFFALLGLETISAKNGEEALEVFRKGGPFDLYVIDIKVPKIDGFTLARFFRESDSHTPILFLSGWVDQEIQERTKEIPGTIYLKKPATFEQIKKVLKDLEIIP